MGKIDFKLRRWRTDDLESLVKYADNWNVAKNLTDKFPHPYTHKDGLQYLDFATKAENIFAIELDGEAVGSIGFFLQDDVHSKNAEIGYWLAEPFWGRGFVTKAIKQTVDFAFKNYEIERIFARPFGTNLGSQKVLEKAGFIFEARFEKSIYKNGEFLDELFYAIRRKS